MAAQRECEIHGHLIRETTQFYIVEYRGRYHYLPRSETSMEFQRSGTVRFTLPEWLAIAKGLTARSDIPV